MGEFDLINTLFKRPVQKAALGVGDDCALLRVAPGMHLAVSTDMLVAGRHFQADVNPLTLGHKALAVNLSDLAAVGATPLAFTLALSLPTIDIPWLRLLTDGLFALADLHGCELVGGDTTAGPLTLSITVMGEVPVGAALKRSGAQVGDDIYCSGTLGIARLGFMPLAGQVTRPEFVQWQARTALEMPQPRLALGLALRGMASACIDLSDGLSGDLGHILTQSGKGAVLQQNALAGLMGPVGDALGWPQSQRALWVLAGGDDYELCFTAAPALRPALQALAVANPALGPLTRIGVVRDTLGCVMEDDIGNHHVVASTAFDHFS
jgi:thiamine-monophosphate kinase